MIQRLLYDLGIWLYITGIRIKSLSDEKAKKWISGRKNWQKELKTALANAPKNRIWMHCASLGEFEQGRPVLEALRKKYPQHFLLLTFFSPSGFEVRKNYEHADHVSYLPADSHSNASEFLEIVNPDLALFVKYEFWYHFLSQLKQRQIAAILFSAIFRNDQVFFKWYGGLFRKMLTMYSQILVQDEQSKQNLETIGIDDAIIASDTRFDRVAQIAESAQELAIVKRFSGDKMTVVAGSTWPHDLPVLQEIDLSQTKLIIAPHDLSESTLKEIEQIFSQKTVRYSEPDDQLEHADILIIDNIGMLAAIYKYGDVAYVGGGFGDGIHNTLEPAVYGIPVLFGPNFKKFREARELISNNGAFSSNEKTALAMMINDLISDDNKRKEMGQNARNYVRRNGGGTQQVLKVIDQYL